MARQEWFVGQVSGTEVVNMKLEKCDVQIDRGTKWGNPFKVGRDGNRDQVIRQYALWITKGDGRRLLADLGELRGKRLGCWCRPQACHGEVLVWLLEGRPQGTDQETRELVAMEARAGVPEARVALVTGSRNWTDREAIERALQQLPAGSTVIHGGAQGADRIAGQVAMKLGLRVQVFPADWRQHGRSAGYRRNQQMLEVGKPHVVLAFPMAGSKGTIHMMKIAREAGVPVQVLEPTVHTELITNRDGTRSRVLTEYVEDSNPIGRCINCEDAKLSQRTRRNTDLWARGRKQQEQPQGGATCHSCLRRKAQAARVTLTSQAITWKSCSQCGAPEPCMHCTLVAAATGTLNAYGVDETYELARADIGAG